MDKKPLIFLTGVTGYVGGRLKLKLEAAGYPLRCLVRSKASIPKEHLPSTQYVVADLTDKKKLGEALNGVDILYYFIHSMGSSSDFIEMDRRLARLVAEAAALAHVKKIIYLGGLGNNYDDELSRHLKSRHEVGHILRANADGVQVIEFRASIVIGSGSLSFEMIRALVERLPIMITPKWVRTLSQPIGIEDLLTYLTKAVDCDVEGNPIFEIGGKDKMSYGDLMKEYANQRGLKRLMLPVPVLSPRLSSLWLGLVTPLYARVGKKLIESALCETIVHDPLASHYFHVQPMSIKDAIEAAIKEPAATRWNDALSAASHPKDWSGVHFGERLIDSREVIVNVPPHIAFAPIRKIGGNQGYYALNWLWYIRGLLDMIIGGVGFRRGRKDPENLNTGDVVDFWRVSKLEKDHYLKLAAEMKVPGRAWLEFTVEPCNQGSKITQKAIFDPDGTKGILYWYLLYPLHYFVFSRMLKGIEHESCGHRSFWSNWKCTCPFSKK